MLFPYAYIGFTFLSVLFSIAVFFYFYQGPKIKALQLEIEAYKLEVLTLKAEIVTLKNAPKPKPSREILDILSDINGEDGAILSIQRVDQDNMYFHSR